MTCIGYDHCCPVGPWIKNMTLGFLLPSLNLLASRLLGDLTAMLFLVSLKVFKFRIFSLVCLLFVLWYCGKCLLFLLGLWSQNEGLQTANGLESMCMRGNEMLEHLLPIDPDGFHLENIYPRTAISIGFPCLDQSDRLTSRATRGTI